MGILNAKYGAIGYTNRNEINIGIINAWLSYTETSSGIARYLQYCSEHIIQ